LPWHIAVRTGITKRRAEKGDAAAGDGNPLPRGSEHGD